MKSRHRRQSSGQTLPLFAIMAPGMLALMALGLDAAQVFLERRDAQGAADLAALAAVVHLPDDDTAARNAAWDNAAANGYPQAQVTPTTPFNGDASQVEVVVDSQVDTFFMQILNFFLPGDYTKVDVSARAVAAEETTAGVAGSGGFAVLSLEQGCGTEEKSVNISGSNDFLIGRVHSNSDISVEGSTNSFTGETTHLCGIANEGGDNVYNPPPSTGSLEPDPINLDYAHFCPPDPGEGWSVSGDWNLGEGGDWWVGGTKDSKLLKPGVYCATGKLELGDQGITIDDIDGLGVTFVSQQQIVISGSDFILTPYKDNVLLASYGDSDVAIVASGSKSEDPNAAWAGMIYAPNGTVIMSGQGLGQGDGEQWTLSGGIVGERVTLNGSNANINGTEAGGPASDPVQTIALIE